MFDKFNLTKEMLARRAQLDLATVVEVARSVSEKIMTISGLAKAKNIGYYVASGGECDPIYAAHALTDLGKVLHLPLMQNKSMAYYQHNLGDALVRNAYGIEEPLIEGQTSVPIQQLDCLLVPLVAFDARCNRMGRGGGYYDRYLADTRYRPLLIGLGYQFQKIDDMPVSEWDVPMDYVVTEAAIYTRPIS